MSRVGQCFKFGNCVAVVTEETDAEGYYTLVVIHDRQGKVRWPVRRCEASLLCWLEDGRLM